MKFQNTFSRQKNFHVGKKLLLKSNSYQNTLKKLLNYLKIFANQQTCIKNHKTRALRKKKRKKRSLI